MRNISNMLIAALLLAMVNIATAQSVGINSDGSAPNGSAMLDVSSTSKGFLPPRMTYAEKILIPSPTAGLMVWCSNCGTSGELQIYNGTAWQGLTAGTASGLPGAPTIDTATVGNAQASVTFTAPHSNGGSAITIFTVTSNPGGLTETTATAGTIIMTGLTYDTTYTFTVTATNATGTGAASAASNPVTSRIYSIGQSYGGGIIFYIDGSGQHGLIAATSDQSTGAEWGCEGTFMFCTSEEIGTGSANTECIIYNCGSAGIAARICYDLILNGYDDWFLPSFGELSQMFINEDAIGGFAGDNYWSSTEDNFDTALIVPGYMWYIDDNKSSAHYVRAVRAF